MRGGNKSEKGSDAPRELRRAVSVHVRRLVALVPPAHVLALLQLVDVTRFNLSSSLTRLSARCQPLIALLTKPPPPNAISVLDTLPFCLAGSPALDPSTLAMQLEFVTRAARPAIIDTTPDIASTVAPAASTLPAAPLPSASLFVTCTIAVHVQRVRLFVCDDFSGGARNEPTLELHVPCGYIAAQLSPQPTSRAQLDTLPATHRLHRGAAASSSLSGRRAVHVDGGLALEVRGFSQRARLWESLVEGTLVCVQYSNDALAPSVAAAPAATAAAAAAVKVGSLPAPHLLPPPTAASKKGGAASKGGVSGSGGGSGGAVLRVWLPRRVNITVTQQHLRLVRHLISFIQSASPHTLRPPRIKGSTEQARLDRARVLTPPPPPPPRLGSFSSFSSRRQDAKGVAAVPSLTASSSNPSTTSSSSAASASAALTSTAMTNLLGAKPWKGNEMWVVNELGATLWIRSANGGEAFALPPGHRVRLGPSCLVLPAEGDSHGHVANVRTPGLPTGGVASTPLSQGDGLAAASPTVMGGAVGRRGSRWTAFRPGVGGAAQKSGVWTPQQLAAATAVNRGARLPIPSVFAEEEAETSGSLGGGSGIGDGAASQKLAASPRLGGSSAQWRWATAEGSAELRGGLRELRRATS